MSAPIRTSAGWTLGAALAIVAGCSSGITTPEPGLERMIDQPRGSPYGADAGSPDGAMMRRPPAGTVACDADIPGPMTTGMDAQGYLDHLPFPADEALLDRGQDRFAVVCATCHGLLGDGNSPVAQHMETVRPRDLVAGRVRDYPVGRVFQVVTDGFGVMPSQADLLTNRDRWAVAAYVKVLQLSQHAAISGLPADARRHLEAP